MTRGEAMNVLKANYPDPCFSDLRKAVDMAIKALEVEPCEDAVSRQAVSSWLKQYGQDVLHGKYKFSLMYIWKNLMDLPSAQPEQQWIPCSERLPEEDGEYLVLYYTQSKYKPYVCDVISFANDLYQIDEYYFNDKKSQKGWFYCDNEYGFCEACDVYAWMPLPPPEPYKEKS